jgi:hypothetical protein
LENNHLQQQGTDLYQIERPIITVNLAPRCKKKSSPRKLANDFMHLISHISTAVRETKTSEWMPQNQTNFLHPLTPLPGFMNSSNWVGSAFDLKITCWVYRSLWASVLLLELHVVENSPEKQVIGVVKRADASTTHPCHFHGIKDEKDGIATA